MPVAKSRGHAGKALLVAGVAVVLLLGVGWWMASLANKGDVDIRLGDDRFEAGDADTMAEVIEDGGGLPLLFQALAGDRHLFVQHLDPRDKEGWVAFGAFDPDRPECLVEIDRKRDALVNACDRAVTYPLTGEGLRYYPVQVEGGKVLVDINELTTTTQLSRTGR